MPGAEDRAVAKLEADGAAAVTVAAFRQRLRGLHAPDAGLLAGDELEPLGELPALEDLPVPSPAAAREVLDRVVVLKLNGGLGTSMGLQRPQVADRGQARPQLPRRHRPSGAGPARAPRGPPAAGAHELRRDPRAVAARAGPPPGPGRRRPARLPAEPRAQAAGRRPRAGGLARRAGARVVPARPRRRLRLAGGERDARCAAGRRLPMGVRLELRQPRRARRTPHRRPGSPRSRSRSRWRSCAGRRPTARAGTSPATTAAWSCARPRRSPRATTRSGTSSAGAGTTPTTCGSTSPRSTACCASTTARSTCR